MQHIAEHGVSMDDVEDVLDDPDNSTENGTRPDRSVTFGETREGRYLAVVWEEALDDPRTIYPVTAYEVPRPRPKRR